MYLACGLAAIAGATSSATEQAAARPPAINFAAGDVLILNMQRRYPHRKRTRRAFSLRRGLRLHSASSEASWTRMTSRGRRDRIWAIGKESIPACFLIGRAGGGHEDDRDGLADLRRVLGDERHPADGIASTCSHKSAVSGPTPRRWSMVGLGRSAARKRSTGSRDRHQGGSRGDRALEPIGRLNSFHRGDRHGRSPPMNRR